MAIEQFEPDFGVEPGDVVVGPVRADRRTKELVKRLCPGDIAVIDHADIDRVAAENLILRRPSAVVNASTSFTGRYPHVGPLLITEAGIPLIDDVGPEIIDLVDEGEELRLVGTDLWRGEELLAAGHRQDADDLARRVVRARADMGAELEAFAINTLEWIPREARLTFEPLVRPPPRPEGAAGLRPGVPAVPGGRRRRRRRPARGRPAARHHHRRLRLGVGRGAG